MSGTGDAVQRLDRMRAIILHAPGDQAHVQHVAAAVRGFDVLPLEVSADAPTLRCGPHMVVVVVWSARAREQGLAAALSHALESKCAAIMWRVDDEPAPPFWDGPAFGQDTTRVALAEAVRLASLRVQLSDAPRAKRAPALVSILAGLAIGHAIGFGAVALTAREQVMALEQARREVRLAANGDGATKRVEYSLFKPAAAGAQALPTAPGLSKISASADCTTPTLRPALAFAREPLVFPVAMRRPAPCAVAGAKPVALSP